MYTYLRHITIIVALIACGCLFQQCSSKNKSLKEEMAVIVENTNKKCPLPVDNETRLDKMSSPGNNTIQYHYTLLNVEKESVNIDPMMEPIRQHILQAIKTDRELKFFRENNVTFIFSYNDSKGNFLFDVTITPYQYKQ